MHALASRDIAGIRAGNPGPFTLAGTNTWVLGRDPGWVVDPGPDLADHVAAVAGEVARRGGLGGVALTHRHADHAAAVGSLLELAGPAPVAAAPGATAPGPHPRPTVAVVLGDGDRFGPLRAVATPGHCADHLAFVAGTACFTGDAVLGQGSVFIAPGPGSLSGYLDSLRRLRALGLELICPGHGPPVTDPAARLDAYLEHRLEREARLVAALGRGLRRVDELLDAAWHDVPPALRLPAAVTLAAHLDKLEEEGRLPPGVQRPAVPARLAGGH